MWRVLPQLLGNALLAWVQHLWRNSVAAFLWVVRCIPIVSRFVADVEDQNQHTNIEGLVALFGAVLAQVAAGLYFVQGRDIPPQAFAYYGLIGAAIVISMGTIVGSSKQVQGRTMYTHDRGTVTAGKWMIVFSAALLVFFVRKGSDGALPGQGAEEFKVIQARLYEDDTGKIEQVDFDKAVATPTDLPWLTLDVPVRPDQFNGSIPTQFTIRFKFSGKLNAPKDEAESTNAMEPKDAIELEVDWRPVQAQLFRITPDRWKERILNYPRANPSISTVEVNVPVPEDKYVLEVYLEPQVIKKDLYLLDANKRREQLQKLVDLRNGVLEDTMGNVSVSIEH